jgi:hypothetical protein
MNNISCVIWFKIQNACKHLRNNLCQFDPDNKAGQNAQWCRLKDCPLLMVSTNEEVEFYQIKEQESE